MTPSFNQDGKDDGMSSNASETTSLLATLPSAHSTSRPTRPRSTIPLASSFEDVRESVEQETLLSFQEDVLRSKSARQPSIGLTRRQSAFILVIGCALAVAFVSFPVLRWERNHMAPQPDGHGKPFSLYHPVHDLGLLNFVRAEETSPPAETIRLRYQQENEPARLGSGKQPGDTAALPLSLPVPTNAWYQNMLLLRGEPSNIHRVYSTPYVLDPAGLIPGINVHANHIDSSSRVMQLSYIDNFGLAIGAAGDAASAEGAGMESRQYSVVETTELGVTLQWNALNMTSTLVRGLPYVTMTYEKTSAMTEDGRTILPTVAAELAVGRNKPIADSKYAIDCTTASSRSDKPTSFRVERDVELYFPQSDYTWLVFFSHPAWVQCISNEADTDSGGTFLQVVDVDKRESDNSTFIIRTAMLNHCTTGSNQMSCRQGLGHLLPQEISTKGYGELLRRHAKIYPGQATFMDYEIDETLGVAKLILDWDVQTMGEVTASSDDAASSSPPPPALLMFALPHHLDKLSPQNLPDNTLFCTSSLIGPTCLVEGASWSITEDLPTVGFRAARPPKPEFLPGISKALKKDINYTLPHFFRRGAGDTYFSGKMLARLARILIVAEEAQELCHGSAKSEKSHAKVEDGYTDVCLDLALPSAKDQSAALNRLRQGVQVWIDGTAETPFVYDSAWGGIVSCGCQFQGHGCKNRVPDCPAFVDQGLNFGNGFYNDHHFHYGYHIYAAAVVAHFDADWGRNFFEQVVMLVRDIANPSVQDPAFPLFRHKDWYQGSSWASGVPLPPYLNGKNQESTSEAIAAYEAVALYGRIMGDAWKAAGNTYKMEAANEIHRVGLLLTATELRSANRYWHVMQNDESKRIYPEVYDANVIGILWSTMAQFGTWFGAAPYLPYGIQLLPLTSISEERDDLAWANEMYYPFSKACAGDFECTRDGWVVLELAILATVGYPEVAANRLDELLDDTYESAGGNGHSKTNTLWYIATRPNVQSPIWLDDSDWNSERHRPAPVFALTDCHTPETCTDQVLNSTAGKFTCRERIDWLMTSNKQSQWEACERIGSVEFPHECGRCDPNRGMKKASNVNVTAKDFHLVCPPCSPEECASDLNRCPVYENTFVCSQGSSYGGCSGEPWSVDGVQCNKCCEMTQCHKLRDDEAKKVLSKIDQVPTNKNACPPCAPSVCYGTLNQCSVHSAPYLCVNGTSIGGCSVRPWDVGQETSACHECCEVTADC